MKILLINCPIRINAKPNNIPYGLATIASSLRGYGFEVEIYDINALRPKQEDIIAALRQKSWDIAGISGLITTYDFQKWLISLLKGININGLVISGGGLATSVPELLFNNTGVDIAVCSEGEQTMIELCQAINTGQDLSMVPGIMFRQDGRIITTETRENINDLDTIPFPAWDLLPMEIYLENPIWGDVANNSSGFKRDVIVKRSMNIISSRGCPFSCNYCYHLFGHSNYRFRSAINVVKEIKALVREYSVDFIGFVDDNMMASESRLIEFCDLLEKEKLPITWGCHGRITNARPDILEQMAGAGCVWIGYGIESGSQKILDLMNKKARVEEAKQAIINTRKAGIYANTTFIFGYPGETVETIQDTINFKRELAIECGSFFATPYPDTPLFKQVRPMIKDLEAFVLSLGNATDFSINLTQFDDTTMFMLKRAMDENRDVM